jgi:hypothetical protein
VAGAEGVPVAVAGAEGVAVAVVDGTVEAEADARVVPAALRDADSDCGGAAGPAELETMLLSEGAGAPLGKLLRDAVGLGAVEAVAVNVGGVTDMNTNPE